MAHLSNDQLGIIRLCHALNQAALRPEGKNLQLFWDHRFLFHLKRTKGDKDFKGYTWYICKWVVTN